MLTMKSKTAKIIKKPDGSKVEASNVQKGHTYRNQISGLFAPEYILCFFTLSYLTYINLCTLYPIMQLL